MKKRNFGILLVLAANLLCLDAFAEASQPMPEFSADVVTQSQGHEIQSKTYISNDKVRSETMGQTMIIRKDLNVMWMVMPDQAMYMENPIDLNALARTSQTMPGEIERLPLGKEMVGDQATDKFKVTYDAGKGPVTMFQWISDKQIPIKMQSEDGSWSVDYKNIQFGPQPASLFEIPAGYQKMQMPNIAELMRQQNTE